MYIFWIRIIGTIEKIMCFRTTGQFQLLYTCIIELQYVIVRGKLKKCFENWSLQATLFQHGEWPARCLLMKNRPEWEEFSNSQESDFVILNKQGSLSCHTCYDPGPLSTLFHLKDCLVLLPQGYYDDIFWRTALFCYLRDIMMTYSNSDPYTYICKRKE